MNSINSNSTIINNRQQQQQQQLHRQQQHQQLHHSENLAKCSSVVCYSNQQNQIENFNNNFPMTINDSIMTDCQENYSNGYYCESTGSMTDYINDEDQTMSSSTQKILMTNSPEKYYYQKQQQQYQQHHQQLNNNTSIAGIVASPAHVTMSSIMVSTAASVFRNCCGGGCSSSTTGSTLTINSINNNNYKNMEKITVPTLTSASLTNQTISMIPSSTTTYPQSSNLNEEDPDFILFRALIKKLKEPQLTTLCQTIESITSATGYTGAIGNSYATASNGQHHQPDCVLVPRGTIMGEEPNLIACRLWRWPDLRNSNELKSIPSCPNEKDRVYVCCNPSHWSRIWIHETPPPPYQSIAMERLKPEDRAPSERIKDGGNNSTSSNDSIKKRNGAIGTQFPPGSLTTDGEDSSLISSSWCELAYWELAQRVGGRFPVENSTINIFWDQYRGDGMCLKTLAEQRLKLAPDSVIKARQKIGLGVTLSQDADGVWLYNRSLTPVFVHSPTLNNIENWFNVTKVPPGYCLKAFDNYKAKTKTLVWPPQIAGAQTGPVDTKSMRISFAKGWGPTYTRQDVTACPCWLEVLLTRNR